MNTDWSSTSKIIWARSKQLASWQVQAGSPVDGWVLNGRLQSGLEGCLSLALGQSLLAVLQGCATARIVIECLLGCGGLPLHELEGNACPIGDDTVRLQPHHLFKLGEVVITSCLCRESSTHFLSLVDRAPLRRTFWKVNIPSDFKLQVE